MLRLLHTADVHLGARHADLGDRASTQRERQFAAFVATIDLALVEKVDLVLVAGDRVSRIVERQDPDPLPSLPAAERPLRTVGRGGAD
jgi:hypothetical protein